MLRNKVFLKRKAPKRYCFRKIFFGSPCIVLLVSTFLPDARLFHYNKHRFRIPSIHLADRQQYCWPVYRGLLYIVCLIPINGEADGIYSDLPLSYLFPILYTKQDGNFLRHFLVEHCGIHRILQLPV